jgi:hypothetical protein
MRVGIEIERYLVYHADYAFRSDGLKAYKLAQRILEWIKSWKHQAFSSRELQRSLGGKTLMGTIEPALHLLERHNIIRILHKPGGGHQCLVHPHARSL